MKTFCFALMIAVMATPVLAAETSDYIEYQPLTPKVPNSDRVIPKQPDNANQSLTVYGSYEKNGSGVGASTSTSNGKKWKPVIDVTIGTGF